MTPTIMRTGSRMWKYQGSIKKGVEFPDDKKKSCGISMGIGSWPFQVVYTT